MPSPVKGKPGIALTDAIIDDCIALVSVKALAKAVPSEVLEVIVACTMTEPAVNTTSTLLPGALLSRTELTLLSIAAFALLLSWLKSTPEIVKATFAFVS
jgi:hypothetical protein